MKCIFLLLILIGCGKSPVNDEVPLPYNQASPLETSELDQALDHIQADFDKINVSVNLRAIPYKVTNLKGYNGVCYTNAKGEAKGIALDHRAFAPEANLRHDYGLLYYVLLHEIGHCFFKRKHEDVLFFLKDHQFVLNFKSFPAPVTFPFLYVTVMKDRSPFFEIIPDDLWPYYVKEIAGLERMKSWEDFKAYTDIKVVPGVVVQF